MKKGASIIAFMLVMALSCVVFAGCSGEADNAGPSDGTAPLMPVDHDGRFDVAQGGDKCYNCHGATPKANPKVEAATAMPEDHYADGSYESLAIDPVRMQCVTCHAQDHATE